MRPRDQTREARLQYAGKSTQKYPHRGIRKRALNPGTYTQSHTPIVVQRGGGGGGVVDGLPFPTVFDDCDVTSNGRHLGCHLGFYHELEIR